MKYCHNKKNRFTFPVDKDVFKTSSGLLKKVPTSYNQTKRPQDVWQKTSFLRRLEDVRFTLSWRRWIYDVLKKSDLRRLEGVCFMTFWKRLICDILKTSDLRRLEDVGFTPSWRCLTYDVLKTLDFRLLEDVWLAMSWGRLFYDFLKTSDLRRPEDVCRVTSVLQRRSDVYTASK